MAGERKDNRHRILKTGESQRSDGTYQYRYKQVPGGKWYDVYAQSLEKLRAKEKPVQKDIDDGLDYSEGGL